MAGLLPHVDPDGLLEYSVVYTDRALNHMSASFQGVMKDISALLKQVYGAQAAIVVPGSGTYGMEAVARQFATGKKCLVIRNGWFSFRWTQIFEMGNIPSEAHVLKARRSEASAQAPFAPVPLAEAQAAIRDMRPDLVFAPHVETASGMMLPDDYIKGLADAVHEHGGMLMLDCIASGAMWVNMQQTGVDVLISAPQKGWSASPCAGLVMLNDRALAAIEHTQSTSFACDLKKWLQIMQTYENGGFAYHATMPTDALKQLRDAIQEAQKVGFDTLKAQQAELGARVRALLVAKGFPSVAAAGFQAPGVVVSYTRDAGMQSGKKFTELGLQIAAGVPLQCDEGSDFQTFRLGLFGLDKLADIDRTINTFEKTLNSIA
ncbi:aminotransferase class V-fold PLP-dependent enzyme [Burkholderiaceae bacterium DAT-1]|nr:aminotransferase class V-fold PLP-dependent enzyme [Burkholderiaceae bacterium DAT-1]